MATNLRHSRAGGNPEPHSPRHSRAGGKRFTTAKLVNPEPHSPGHSRAGGNPATLITECLNIWTSADTAKKTGRGRASSNAASVYGIKKLRELILELAVRGHLVPQDASDESASELLKKIQAEKNRLIKAGMLKKDKPLISITEDERLFELPIGWAWTKLQEVFDVRDGTHDTPKYVEIGFPLVTSKNLYTGTLNFSDIKYISEITSVRLNIKQDQLVIE